MDIMDYKMILEIVVVIFQVIITLFLIGIKMDIKDLWKRIYSHYHEIDCENPDCKKLKTGNVIVPHEG
jgi:hypothetical protein